MARIAARLATILTLLAAGCDTQRDRPTGPAGTPVSTSVAVTAPVKDAVVGADSVVSVVIAASGELEAVEFFAIRISLPDTVAHERRVFATQQDEVEETFQFQVPKLPTGVNLEIRGVAENVLGERLISEPIFVVVIDCDQFPISCGGGP